MHHSQVLIHEPGQRLAAMLGDAARRNGWKWLLRQPRKVSECLECLRRGGPGVLVLQVGRNLENEMGLLATIKYLFPEAGAVVVGESAQAPLAGLAWDIGADYVLILPQPHDMLAEIVAGLIRPRSAKGGG